MPQKPSLRLRLASAILGSRAKEYIPALSPFDGMSFDGAGRLNQYDTKQAQIAANIGWCFAANTAIVDTCSAIAIKLYKKKKDGDREEITEHEILDLLETPNLAHTGEQLKQLHFTYMNFVGESYIYMMKSGGEYLPRRGQLPDALQIFPAHQVQFKLGTSYTKSTIKLGKDEYPLMAFVRDINPDPSNPYFGRSIISASAPTIDTENQMKEWNRRLFANNARPSLVFSSTEQMSDESYERWKQQFQDEHTGTDNAYKPILIEGGTATPYMMNQQDLDFLESRKFSMTEILAMWRVNPYILGSVENVNLATARAARIQHAEINIEPRLRQFVRQLNSTLVSIYDPSLELDFENPIPEDIEAKLAAAVAGVDKWWTKDEVRDMYGEEPLPDGLGEQIIVIAKGAMTLEDVVAGEGKPAPVQNPEDPDADNDDDLTDGDPADEDPELKKSLAGVKKNS